MITIYDWQGASTTIDIDINDDKYMAAKVEVITGDEILTLIDKDGVEIEYYDSSSNRMADFADGCYYIKIGGELVENFERWENRRGAYDYLDYLHGFDNEEEES